MSSYRMLFDSGWESNAFEPLKEVEFKTADKKTIVYSKIVYGKWIYNKISQLWECSACHKEEIRTTKFCSNCGADMRGGTE